MSDFAKTLSEKLVISTAELVVLAEQMRLAHAELLAEYPILRALDQR